MPFKSNLYRYTEAYFHGQFLVLEANGVKGQRASMPFLHPFKLKRWMCVAVEYSPLRWGCTS